MLHKGRQEAGLRMQQEYKRSFQGRNGIGQADRGGGGATNSGELTENARGTFGRQTEGGSGRIILSCALDAAGSNGVLGVTAGPTEQHRAGS